VHAADDAVGVRRHAWTPRCCRRRCCSPRVMIEMNGATVSDVFALFAPLLAVRHARETRLAS
jgi:hypothetical protein